MTGYSRARTAWHAWPQVDTIARAIDFEKWDQAILDLKNLTPNVKDYGAIGDGITNDQTAIHATRDAAGTGFMVFPTATYLTSALTTLLFSKIDGYGSTLKPSANSISILTLKAGSDLLSGDMLLVRDLILDGSGKTGITGVSSDVGDATSLASLVLENLYVMNCDTYAIDLKHAQFIRTYNIRATSGNGVGMRIANNAVAGGGNSHDHYGLHLGYKEVGLFVNGTRFGTGCTSLNFYNPQVLQNSVCGMAFFDANATLYGGAPEGNATGAATKTVDSQTVKRCSIQANNSIIRLENFLNGEAADPVMIAENKAVLTLKDINGGTGAVLVQCDDTSSVHLEGMFNCPGIVQGVTSWPDAWILPPAGTFFYGEPVHTIDPTLAPLYAHPAPVPSPGGAHPPTTSYVEDADLGYCTQAVFTAFAGSVNDNLMSVVLGSAAASKSSAFSVLVKSSIDTQLGINLWDGAVYNTLNADKIYLKAGKVTRIVFGRPNLAAGTWQITFYPVAADAPTIKFSSLQLYQGTPNTAATNADIAKIIKYGAFSPGPTRATAANLALKANVINTAGKYPGKQAWDTTNNRFVVAAGRADTDVWKDGVNTTVYTPV